jgi:hypothetical protein
MLLKSPSPWSWEIFVLIAGVLFVQTLAINREEEGAACANPSCQQRMGDGSR